ncbi:MAG: hypothetical protein P4L66_06935 [Acetobacteraceae bacterium]|nr:hypothetical protein [Acetobacteraceae bacterium]
MSILRGIVRVARFRVEGLAEFDVSGNGFLNSLAPLVAFPLVGCLLELSQGSVIDALSDFLASVVALLAPLAISEILAKRWQAGPLWLGYAVATNWSQWILPMAMAAMLSAFWVMHALGIESTQPMVVGGVVGVLLYGVALHWFLARRALGLSRLRSFLLVSICDLATLALVMGPRLIALHLNGS